MRRFLIATTLATAALGGGVAGAQTPATVGSASWATHRSCSATAPTQVCDGTGAGQRIITSSYGGGTNVGGLNSLDVGGGNVAWSDVWFDSTSDLPVIRAYTSAPGDTRMNVNAFGFQSFAYSGPAGTPFALTGDLHIVNSSGAPTAGGDPGALPGGVKYSQYVAVWDPSIIAGLTTPQELFNSLFYADCSTPGVLAFGLSSGDLAGGEQSLSVTTTGCGGPLTLTPGQEVLVVSGLQLPVNRGGFADSTATFRTRIDETGLTPEEIANLEAGLSSALDRGAPLANVPTITQGVPEPATWAMMMLGFGLIGAFLRRTFRRSEERFNAKIRRIEAGENL